MKKYSVFSLYIIIINRQKFICEEIIPSEKYREILTGRKINLKKNYQIEKLSNYYSLLAATNYMTKKPLMLSKYDILIKYIDINRPEVEKYYYPELTKLSYLILQTVDNPDLFYSKIGEKLTKEERQYIKSLLPRSCDTCINGCCEEQNKPIYDCVDWENDKIIGEYKVLRLNRKNTENNTNNDVISK